MVACGENGSLSIYDQVGKKTLFKEVEYDIFNASRDFFPDEQKIAYSTYANIHIFDICSESSMFLTEKKNMAQLVFLDNEKLLINSWDSLSVYNVVTQKKIANYERKGIKKVIHLVGLDIAVLTELCNDLKIMTLNERKATFEEKMIENNYRREGECISVSDVSMEKSLDGGLLALGYRSQVDIWRIEENGFFPVAKIKLESYEKDLFSFISCCFNPSNNGQIFVGTNLREQAFFLLDIKSGNIIDKYNHITEDRLKKIYVSLEGNSIIFTDAHGFCYQYEKTLDNLLPRIIKEKMYNSD